MPGMGLKSGRRGMVAGNHQHIRLRVHQNRQIRIGLLDNLDLPVEVAVLPGFVGVLDMDKQIILRQTIHKSPRNDYPDLIPLLQGIKTTFVCADKGYDSTKNHKFVIKNLQAKSLIKVRKNLSTHSRSTLRRKIANNFDEKLYHQRSKTETIFSVIKRKYDSHLKARTFSTQKKEIIFKLITYNIDKIINFYLPHRGFQQSR